MKKVIAVIFMLMFVVGAAKADVFFGLKAGVGEQEDNLKDTISNPSNYSYSDSNAILGAEFGLELFGDSTNRFGAKIGLNSYGKIDTEDYSVNEKMLLKNTMSIPLTVYYKYAPSKTGLHLWAGAGATWATLKFQDEDATDSFSQRESQIFPHVAAGIEWRIIELVGVGLDLNYNFDAKIKSGGLYRDFTGLEGFLGVRVYLF